MTNHVPTLETCQKLKAAGFPQEMMHLWVKHSALSSKGIDWDIRPYDPYTVQHDKLVEDYCAAPILTEILEQLPTMIDRDSYCACLECHKKETSTRVLYDLKYVDFKGFTRLLRCSENPAEAAAQLWLALHESEKAMIQSR